MVRIAATGFPKGEAKSDISWEEFEREYLTREDNYKYEWVNGSIETSERTMNQYQFYIQLNLRKFFQKLLNENKVDGALEAEVDTFFSESIHRRPDMAYFSDEQIAYMAYGENQVPEFVIEVVSTNDSANKLQKKMKNYRDAGVKVIWQIYPALKEIHVHLGEDSTVCSGDKICSAAPVLPDFTLPAKEVFLKPPKPKN